MQYNSVFDIIGPVMLGPSSSHTAGAVRIGKVARMIFGSEPLEIQVVFYGSFAETYKGHATDVAVVGGVLDFEPDDERITQALSIAQERGIHVEFLQGETVPDHPNTLKIILGNARETVEIVGVSLGGGAIQIIELNQFPLNFSDEQPTLLILHQDQHGTIAAVAGCLSKYAINISHMEVSRLEKGKIALMVIETDQSADQPILEEISSQANIIKVIQLRE